MKCDLVCIDKKPQEYRKLFWGDYGNFNRIDFTNFEIFKKIAENSESNTWFINEIDCTKDREGWERLPENAKRMFRLNIVYQTLMDSLVPGIFDKLSDFSTDSWLTYLYSRIFTEEQIHCLREDDEILTDKGWKKLKDLTMDDKVANWWLNEDNEVGNITFERPISIKKQFYNGKMVYWKMNNMEYIVTPKHRVVAYTTRYGDIRWKVDCASNYSLHNYKFPISGFKNYGWKEKLEFIERLAIAFQADGTFMNKDKYGGAHKTYKGYAYIFVFKKKRKIERMKWILNNIKCEYKIIKLDNGYIKFHIWVDKEFDKNFDWVNLDEITSNWGKEFLEELKYWDGASHNNKQVIRFINTNKKAIDKVIAIASISGYQVGIDDKLTERRKDSCNFKNLSKSYCLYLTPKTYKTGRKLKKSLIDYEGNIVGVEVPSTFIIVRFNGKYVAITGNSLSYSSGITQAFGEKGSEILDIVYDDEILKKRVETEQKIAYRFIKEVYPLKEPNDNAKKIILELLYRTLLLEGVKFPFSFFVTWNINLQYNNAIQGFSHLLQLIAWDEMTVHTATGVNLINILRKEKDQGFSHLFESGWFSKMVKEVTKEVIDLEMIWIDYLLQEGDIPGFNKEIGEYFVKYWANKRLKEVKEEPLYKGFEKENDIIQWFNNYRNLNNKKVSLQEADNTNYMKGVLKNDVLDYEFKK